MRKRPGCRVNAGALAWHLLEATAAVPMAAIAVWLARDAIGTLGA